MKNYITDTDPTLSQTRWMVVIMWAVTTGIIVSMFIKPPVILTPIYYPLNGAIFNSEYMPGEIK